MCPETLKIYKNSSTKFKNEYFFYSFQIKIKSELMKGFN